MTGASERWIRFLRQYGPIPRNDNMFDEHIRRSADRLGVRPISFKHPLEDDLFVAFDRETVPQSAVRPAPQGMEKATCAVVSGTLWAATPKNGKPMKFIFSSIQPQAANRPLYMSSGTSRHCRTKTQRGAIRLKPLFSSI